MGQMKNLYLDQLEADNADQPVEITIYVLTMGGKPCNAYTDKAEADYEAWLCLNPKATPFPSMWSPRPH